MATRLDQGRYLHIYLFSLACLDRTNKINYSSSRVIWNLNVVQDPRRYLLILSFPKCVGKSSVNIYFERAHVCWLGSTLWDLALLVRYLLTYMNGFVCDSVGRYNRAILLADQTHIDSANTLPSHRLAIPKLCRRKELSKI